MSGSIVYGLHAVRAVIQLRRSERKLSIAAARDDARVGACAARGEQGVKANGARRISRQETAGRRIGCRRGSARARRSMRNRGLVLVTPGRHSCGPRASDPPTSVLACARRRCGRNRRRRAARPCGRHDAGGASRAGAAETVRCEVRTWRGALRDEEAVVDQGTSRSGKGLSIRSSRTTRSRDGSRKGGSQGLTRDCAAPR